MRVVSVAELAAASREQWCEVFPAWRTVWPERIVSGPIPEPLRSRLSCALPARGVLRLRGARVWGDEGWVFTADGRVVPEVGAFGDAQRWMPSVHLPWLLGRPRRLRGRTLSLLSDWAACNYFHVMLEVLPRVEMVRAAGWSWQDFDHILLPAFRAPTVDRLFGRLEIPADKVLRVEWGQFNYFQTEELVCTRFPGGRRTVTPQQTAFVRHLGAVAPAAAKEAGAHGRRIFVCRRTDSRRLHNEAELQARLEARGFVTVDPGAMACAETVFHAADCVVGLHGAALTNLVFCQPGTRVLEILSSDQAYPYFYTVAVHGGLIYDCVIGPADHEVQLAHPFATWRSPSDYTVDIDLVLRALDRLLAGMPGNA